jgi:hypothetical protein
MTREEEVRSEVEPCPKLYVLGRNSSTGPTTSEQLDIPQSPKSGQLESARDRPTGVSHEYELRARRVHFLKGLRTTLQPNRPLFPTRQNGLHSGFPPQKDRNRGPR